MSAKPKKKPRKGRSAYMRVQRDGSLRCADPYSVDAIKRLKPRAGDLVRVVFSKPRDYEQWKKAHALGTVIALNIEDFAEYQLPNGKVDAHGALKKLQRLSGVECDHNEIELQGVGKIMLRVPNSLAFDEMDEAQFQAAYAGFCAYIIKTWWPTIDYDAIEEMASLVGEAA